MAKRLVDNKMLLGVWTGTFQDATMWDVPPTWLKRVCQRCTRMEVCTKCALLASGERLGSVLLQLEVITCVPQWAMTWRGVEGL